MQPGSVDAQQLANELSSLEIRRDAALKTAKSCAKDGMWDCARFGASDALAIDAGNSEAQALLQRAIVEAGWAPLRPRASQSPPTVKHTVKPRIAPMAKAPQSATVDEGNDETRAIVELGWKHPPDSTASETAGAAPAH